MKEESNLLKITPPLVLMKGGWFLKAGGFNSANKEYSQVNDTVKATHEPVDYGDAMLKRSVISKTLIVSLSWDQSVQRPVLASSGLWGALDVRAMAAPALWHRWNRQSLIRVQTSRSVRTGSVDQLVKMNWKQKLPWRWSWILYQKRKNLWIIFMLRLRTEVRSRRKHGQKTCESSRENISVTVLLFQGLKFCQTA